MLAPRTCGALLLCFAASALTFQPTQPIAALRRAGRAAALRPRAPPRAPCCLQGLQPVRSSARLRGGSTPMRMSVSESRGPDFTVDVVEDKIPITLLSGFLGSGKTTLLREMLQNKGGLKVGVVVNDMAAINIDAKLVKSDTSDQAGRKEGQRDSVLGGGLLDTSDVLELQNGCACCSASDELLTSVLKLLLVSAEREEPYDRIVIEMSGVAEPKNIRKQFFDASWGGNPALEYAELKNMVTVVDSANFMRSYQSSDDVIDRPDLVEQDESIMMAADRAIVDLLTEQVEVADYVLLNKADLLAEDKSDQLKAIVTALNPGADVIQCTYGQVDLDVVLGAARDKWVAEADDEDDFRVSVRDAKEREAMRLASAGGSAAEEGVGAQSSHGHEHGHLAGAHSHNAGADEACGDGCDDPSHGHAHGHSEAGHAHEAAHSHTHGSAASPAACEDEACTDPSHAHGEAHGHVHSHVSSADLSPEDKFGISSFVYSRRRPFHPQRLKELIAKLPVSSGQDKTGLDGWVSRHQSCSCTDSINETGTPWGGGCSLACQRAHNCALMSHTVLPAN